MMGVSMLLMMVGTYEYLFPAIVLCGLAYGSFNALCPTLISELFGMEHFAKICESSKFHR
jgi:MFS family permease